MSTVTTPASRPAPPSAASGSPDGRPATTARNRLTQARQLIRQHLGITILLGLGAVLRLLFMIAYAPAFWFAGDSGSYIKMGTTVLRPDPTRPVGYPAMLKVLAKTDTHLSVVAVQHLLSLLLAVTVYALLQRRGLPRWLSCLAAAPLIFDSLTLVLGEYLLPDMLFSAIFTAAIVVLLWSPRPGYLAMVASGLLIAAAWITKPTALPVVVLIGLYLLVRRMGWRRVVSYGLGFAVPYLAMVIWIGDKQSVYGSQSGTALYGRTAIISDCDHLDLTPNERIACPDQPLGQRWDRADAFFWRRPARLSDLYTPAGAKRLTDFSMEVIKQQPLDYLGIVAKESAAHFIPGLYLGPMNECLRERLVPPVEFRGTGKAVDRCAPAQARGDFQVYEAYLPTAPTATPLTQVLHRYGEWTRVVPVVLSLGLLLTLVALAAGGRITSRIRFDLLLLILAGPGLTVLTVAVGMYEPRYALPALPLAAIAAALAWHGIRTRTRTKTPASDADTPATAEIHP
jgi:4-amino-4-deoxy-L-arabinose transferase-like glycosyltransferase